MLDRLSDEALRSTQFTWNRPEAPEEEAKDDEEMEEDAEVNLDRVEEDMAGEYSDEEEGDILHIDDFTNYSNINKERGGSGGGRVDPLVTLCRTTVTATAGEVSVLTAGEKGAEVGQELGLVIPGSGLVRGIIVSESEIYQV